MKITVWRLFQIVLFLTLLAVVAQVLMASIGCRLLPFFLKQYWARQTPFEHLETRVHDPVSASKTIIPTENTSGTHVKGTGKITLRDGSSEDMPDKWCQYMKYSNKVNPHSYKFSITAESLCSSDTLFMMIIVPSVCSHDFARKVIRQTWGSVAHTNTWSDGQKLPSIKLAFLFGSPETQACSEILQNENKQYGDIIVSEFKDTYRNLTLKSVAALKWVSYYCSQVQYVMKCDEDTFVHLPRLVNIIRQLNSSNTLIGIPAVNKPPVTEGRWEVNADQYPFRVYTPYLLGLAYVLPGKIVPKLYELSEYFNFIPIEDVFITGILARCANLSYCQKADCGFFNQQKFPTQNFSSLNDGSKCYFYKGHGGISLTDVQPPELSKIWDTFKKNSECFRLYTLYNDLRLNSTNKKVP